MKKKAERLYALMKQDLDNCIASTSEAKLVAESCFHICDKYINKLRVELANYIFPSEKEEIHFFKHINPLFIEESEYYGLLYHAEMFKPPASFEIDMRDFWLRQIIRLEKYAENNKVFYTYWKEGRNDKDHIYFLRNADTGEERMPRILKPDYTASTGVDKIFAMFRALERYKEFSERQLQLVKQ